jgi:hypothetical protein
VVGQALTLVVGDAAENMNAELRDVAGEERRHGPDLWLSSP